MGQRHSLFAAPALLGALLCLPPSITAAQAGQDLPPLSPMTIQVAAGAAKTAGYAAVLDICKYMAEGKGRALPVTSLSFYLSSIKRPHPQYLRDAVVTVVRAPSHGTLVTTADMYGETTYDYMATDKSWLGDDRAEFEIAYQGQKYRVTTRIKMAVDIDDGRDDKSCDARVRRIAHELSGLRSAQPRGNHAASSNMKRA